MLMQLGPNNALNFAPASWRRTSASLREAAAG